MMGDQQRGVPIKVKVHDKRKTNKPAGEETMPAGDDAFSADDAREDAAAGEQHDYLADLQRLQAEFENYRKRMMKDQAAVVARTTSRMIESLLPVLDNFERAIAHGEGGPGVEMVFRELKDKLVAEGLEEIEAQDQPFDPRVHEAVESIEDDAVDVATCRDVYRRGYRFKGQLLRPAAVVVARPPESDESAAATGGS